MPTFTNTSPVVLTVDGQAVPVGGTVEASEDHPSVAKRHLTPAPKPAKTRATRAATSDDTEEHA